LAAVNWTQEALASSLFV